MQGRQTEARKIMADVRGLELRPSSAHGGELRGPHGMEMEFQDMVEGIEAEQKVFAGTNYFTAYLRCFSTKQHMWYRTGLGMMLQTLQQLNGQNFFYYYGPTFFSAAAGQDFPTGLSVSQHRILTLASLFPQCHSIHTRSSSFSAWCLSSARYQRST